MPAIRVRDNDVPDVYSGKRKQIILRGCQFKQDDRLFLYAPDGRHRLRSTRCDEVHSIHISSNTVIIVDHRVLTDGEKQQLAIDDGFDDFKKFMQSLKDRDRLPLEGQVIRWL